MVLNNTGFFEGFDLRDARSLRSLAIGVKDWVAGGRDPNSAELRI